MRDLQFWVGIHYIIGITLEKNIYCCFSLLNDLFFSPGGGGVTNYDQICGDSGLALALSGGLLAVWRLRCYCFLLWLERVEIPGQDCVVQWECSVHHHQAQVLSIRSYARHSQSREQYWQCWVRMLGGVALALHSAQSSSPTGSRSFSSLIKAIPCSQVASYKSHCSKISVKVGRECVLGPCSQSFLFLKSQFINDKEMHSNSFVDNRNKFLHYKDKILYGIFLFSPFDRADGQSWPTLGVIFSV